jgi:hypothetical protein
VEVDPDAQPPEDEPRTPPEPGPCVWEARRRRGSSCPAATKKKEEKAEEEEDKSADLGPPRKALVEWGDWLRVAWWPASDRSSTPPTPRITTPGASP